MITGESSGFPDFSVMDIKKLKAFCEGMYYVYARRELIYPDPLHFLYQYEGIRNREVVGLIASSLAYGRVAQIMKSVDRVLSVMGSDPYTFLKDNKYFDVVPDSFKHRFTTNYDMNNFLANISGVIREYDSIEDFMRECMKLSHGDMLGALDEFAERLSRNKAEGSFSLITAPKDGSACKRLFMYLRWLVRHDDVDPGGWSVLKPSQLYVPLDTHMYQISVKLGLTKRKSADLVCCREISSAFSRLSPTDTAKFDFSLSRLGIRSLQDALHSITNP